MLSKKDLCCNMSAGGFALRPLMLVLAFDRLCLPSSFPMQGLVVSGLSKNGGTSANNLVGKVGGVLYRWLSGSSYFFSNESLRPRYFSFLGTSRVLPRIEIFISHFL